MKIGVTTENGVICGHFGHAKNFSVFTVEDGKIVSREELDTQGNHCSSMPDFVLQNKVWHTRAVVALSVQFVS